MTLQPQECFGGVECGKATAPIAVEDGDQWDIQLSDLQRQKSFERQENLPVNGEVARIKRLLAASAAHIAVKMHGRAHVTLKDGVVVATPSSGDTCGTSSERVPVDSRGSEADWPLANISSFVEAMGNKSRDLSEALMDRCLLEEAEASERALAGAKQILFKYSRCQSFYLEIIQKLVAVGLVSVVNSDDGLQLCMAFTLLMAAATGMAQPYFHPQANSVQCCSFACLALAAVGFSYEFTWLSRGSLAVPFLLSAGLALRPDSTESLAVRIWRQMGKEIPKLQDGKPLEVLVAALHRWMVGPLQWATGGTAAQRSEQQDDPSYNLFWESAPTAHAFPDDEEREEVERSFCWTLHIRVPGG
ncbi:unnamed protein product [Durusdinium trenchii]|uniref:Uncharacterized protein n=1 Tax=Durusdinium trenchii TaxID=1381693 RepID=A0ABP0L9Y9_9DINO